MQLSPYPYLQLISIRYTHQINYRVNDELPNCEKSANPVQEKLGAFKFVVWKQDSESRLLLTEAFSLAMASMTTSKIPSLVLAPSVIGAVARARTSNPATVLILCLPVVRKNGELGGYRWVVGWKKALLRMEEALPDKLKR